MERIPQQQAEAQVTHNYYVTEKPKKNPAEVIDFAMGAVFVILFIAIVATYFVSFNMSAMISLRKITWQAFWVWLASWCTGELAKRIFRRKGQKTEEYKKAEEEANKAIQELNESEYVDYAPDYCRDVTEKTIERYRKHQLTTVGIKLETFYESYQGKGGFFLIARVMKGELSLLQARAIKRCNHIATKPYDHRFITAYDAEDNSALTPQQWYDANMADRKDNFRSIILSAFASFGVCGIFYDFFVDFSSVAIFAALVKIVVMTATSALRGSVGWNLSIMEIKRNKTRAGEAKSCMAWAKAKVKAQETAEV